MKDKTDRLFEAIEHPDRFSDEEILQMLEDSEVRELYELMGKTSDALTETSDPDIDDEWKRFAARQSKTITPPMRRVVNPLLIFFTRNAAAILICVVASLAVVAATIGVTHSLQTPKAEIPTEAVAMSDPAEKNDSVQVSGITSAEPQTVIFKNEPFNTIIRTIADYYGVSVNCNNDKAGELRLYFQWDRTLPLDEIVEQLNNFEQIKIKLTDDTITIE